MFNKIIDSEHFANNFDSAEYLSADTLPAITDYVRYANGAFYYQKDRKVENFKNENKSIINIEAQQSSSNTDILYVKANTSLFKKQYFENGILKTKFDSESWKSYINNYFVEIFGNIFTDHVSEYTSISKTNGDQFSSDLFYNYSFKYGFNSKTYENSITSLAHQEHILPDMFTLSSNKNAQIDTERENLTLSYGGLVPESLHEELLNYDKVNSQVKNYFDSLGNAINSEDGLVVRNQLLRTTEKFKILHNKDIKNSVSAYGDFVPFPFYTLFTFSNSLDDNLSKKLTQNFILDEVIGEIEANTLYANIQQVSLPINFTKNFLVNTDNVSVKLFNFKNWIRATALQLGIPQGTDSLQNTHSRSVAVFDTVEYIKKNVNIYKRTFSEILNGKNCNVYNLFYKITKKANTSKNDILQTFYLEYSDSEVIKFFDTQVKYNKKYVYEISLCSLIVGNSYIYNSAYNNAEEELLDISNGVYKIKVTNDTSHQIAELPLFSFEGSIAQNPLSVPNIEITNFDGNNKDLKISFLNLGADETKEYEILEPTDIAIYETLKASDILSTSNKNNDVVNLQVYKTKKKPKLYSDFFGSLVKTFSVDSLNLSIIDSLTPNETYYYSFRAVNDHNIPSNPTLVFKVKLVDEDSLVYLEKEILNLEHTVNKEAYKVMKKYLFIRPSINQRVISNDLDELEKRYKNGETSGIVELGVSRIKVWNKLFKMKVISKESGKVINVYFRFKHKGNTD